MTIQIESLELRQGKDIVADIANAATGFWPVTRVELRAEQYIKLRGAIRGALRRQRPEDQKSAEWERHVREVVNQEDWQCHGVAVVVEEHKRMFG